jgi:hypothetical protein
MHHIREGSAVFTIAKKEYWSVMVGYIKKAVKQAIDNRENAMLPVWETGKNSIPFERKFQGYICGICAAVCWALRHCLMLFV